MTVTAMMIVEAMTTAKAISQRVIQHLAIKNILLCGSVERVFAKHAFDEEFARLVRTTHEWPRGDVSKAYFFLPNLFPVIKLLRRDELLHRKVLRRRLQVLPEGKNIHTGILARPHAFADFIIFLPEAEHDGCFRHQTFFRGFGVAQYRERLLVTSAWVAHALLQPLHRLYIVREHI